MEYREKWYTEKELGDLIESHKFEVFEDLDSTTYESKKPKAIFREFPIGFGFADFLVFNEKDVNLVELKITASIASVKQLLTYKESFSFSIFEMLYEQLGNNLKKYQDILPLRTSIIARYIDKDVFDLASGLGIELYRISIVNNKPVVELMENYIDRPHTGETAALQLKKFYSQWVSERFKNG